jgi:site-specific DNA-methyltransferase (cytosine-N4-specific)
MGERLHPHLSILSTAGFHKDYFFYKFLYDCLGILEGKFRDDSIFVAYYTQDSEEEIKDELLDLIDTGATTIDKAFKVLRSKEKKIKESQMLRMNHFGNGTKGKYQLFNKSSLDMSEIENSSTPLFIFSPPYWVQRHYRNQGVNPFGREETVEEYIQSLMEFIREVRKKLKKNGVMVLIIGETYLNGYQGVCTKAETAIEKEGMKILDVNIWSKSNPKPTPCNERFLNGYEKIIVACNTNEKPVFNKIKKPSSTGKFKVIKGKGKKLGDSNYSLAAPDADITNVFHTSVFNKKEHSSIDKEFQHDAPAPEQIYETFIKAYSMPGDTVVDNFVGGGSVGVALRLGRNVIGYDIDPVNIDFCRKRFDEILGEDVQTLSIAA